ncbi:MAG TPA: hydroxyacylglutathione hydrolase [Casimicrobiaceae bacterium]|jgi:hydroxyacylglutathione hydrolase
MPTIIPIPAFADNYIWLIGNGKRAAVVDPGDAAPVLSLLERTGVTLSAIVATHHHGDHVGGVPRLVERFDVPVFGPAHESIPRRTHALREGDEIDLPGLDVRLRVLDIPGHTAGHIAYVGDVDGPVVFCGDTLFAAGCGRLFEGTPQQMWDSLSKLARLDERTRVYCGHEYTLANLRFAQAVEPGSDALRTRVARDSATRDEGKPTVPSTIADERATNPFLRADLPQVRAAAQAHAGRAIDGAVDSFAVLRQWKNGFRG